MRRWMLPSLILMLLTGCSTLNPYNSNFDCKGYPDGVNCTSAREVYRLTDNKDALSREDMVDDKKGSKNRKPNMLPNEVPPPSGASGKGQSDPPTSAVQGMPYEGPLPLRTTARVMRIWMAPWESQDGALNMSNYVYVEVVERKWSVGEARMQVAPQITPLQTVEAPDAAAPAARPKNRPNPAQPSGRPNPQTSGQKQGFFGNFADQQNPKPTPQFQGFNAPFGHNPQQNTIPKSLSGLPE